MKETLEAIQSVLQKNATAGRRAMQQKFVPGTKKLYGVANPVLSELAKQYKTGGFELVKTLWAAGALEEKLLALKIMERIAKNDPMQSLRLVRQFSGSIDNWAECDAMGMQALKSLVKTHQKEIFALAKQYNQSANMWERRLSLVLVEYYTRDAASLPQINKLVTALENDNEYYVKKAIAWVKRNIAKGR